MLQDNTALNNALGKIKHKILVFSGKGGVGKSSIAANLGVYLALQGHKVGILDIDFHGPSIPKILGMEKAQIKGTEDGLLLPVQKTPSLSVLSVGFMLGEQDMPIIWRGPKKIGAIREFIEHVEWGTLDYLVIDSPPGTGDEPLTIAQFCGKETNAIVVTTPQEVALSDVRKSLSFCNELQLNLLGVVENMSYFVCPHCNEKTEIFGRGKIDEMIKTFKTEILGRIPIEPSVAALSDDGEPFILKGGKTPAAEAMEKMFEKIESKLENKN